MWLIGRTPEGISLAKTSGDAPGRGQGRGSDCLLGCWAGVHGCWMRVGGVGSCSHLPELSPRISRRHEVCLTISEKFLGGKGKTVACF